MHTQWTVEVPTHCVCPANSALIWEVGITLLVLRGNKHSAYFTMTQDVSRVL